VVTAIVAWSSFRLTYIRQWRMLPKRTLCCSPLVPSGDSAYGVLSRLFANVLNVE
jgi:hypothetical protein